MTTTILFFFLVSIVGLFVAAIFCTEDWSGWVGGICAVVLISCIFFSIAQDEKQPIKVHTKQQPQIDTIIEIRNNIPDTTYVYIFHKEEK